MYILCNLSLLCLLTSIVLSISSDAERSDPAMKACSLLHKGDYISSATYLNYGCKLMCTINHKLIYHSQHEGYECPDQKGKRCRNGLCVDPKQDNSYYYLQVTINRGFLPYNKTETNSPPDGYVKMCLINDTGEISRPLKDRSGCDCETREVNKTNSPNWNYECGRSIITHANADHFVKSNRIVFETWDKNFPSEKTFIGSDSLLLRNIIRDELNDKEVMVPMYVFDRQSQLFKEKARIWVRVIWKIVIQRQKLMKPFN